MGNSMDKPHTEKQTDEGSGNGLRYGLSSMQGWRTKMEDRHCAQVGIDQLKDWSFFAIFDGHAGAQVAIHCAENLLNTITQTEQFKNVSALDSNGSDQKESVIQAIKNGFLELDEKMKSLPDFVSGEDKSGTTAICVLISKTHIYIANLGDSRALLCKDSAVVFHTEDHKPSNPEEKKRIMSAGGNVMVQRVNGALAVSRALGDYEYKQSTDKKSYEQLVSPMPEVTVFDFNSDYEFLIMACDGVWDVMENEDLHSYVRHQLSIEESLGNVCSNIIDTCLHKGSKDNISVLVVAFPGAPPISPEAQELDKQLEDRIVDKAKEILYKNPEYIFSDLMDDMVKLDWKDLPPGGGWESKQWLIDFTFNSMTDKSREIYEKNHSKNRDH